MRISTTYPQFSERSKQEVADHIIPLLEVAKIAQRELSASPSTAAAVQLLAVVVRREFEEDSLFIDHKGVRLA